jgi:hypothetical protein
LSAAKPITLSARTDGFSLNPSYKFLRRYHRDFAKCALMANVTMPDITAITESTSMPIAPWPQPTASQPHQSKTLNRKSSATVIQVARQIAAASRLRANSHASYGAASVKNMTK